MKSCYPRGRKPGWPTNTHPFQYLWLLLLWFLVSSAYAQPGQIDMSQSSEWEATAFNNGRRIVRDANGYFHAFWHSRTDLPAAPSGMGAHIYYSYTTLPADEPPSMALQEYWATPICLTVDIQSELPFVDHRYPSAAIEYDIYDGDWQDVNTIHLVWQALIEEDQELGLSPRYEVLYASIPIDNPPGFAMPFMEVENLSLTLDTDSLVPSIAINRYWVDEEDAIQQNIHVVWQEEDINDDGDINLTGDLLYSDIAYLRSTNSGVSWQGPAGGWSGHIWDNITQTPANSQLPSVSCILDQYSGHPARLDRAELGYNTNTVHVAYHEDAGAGEIHIFYQKSPDNGENWDFRIDVTLAVNIAGSDRTEAYPSLAVDMLDRPHIAWMYNNLVPAEPLRQGIPGVDYLAGIHPSETRSYPGPNPGMYGNANNRIAAYYFDGNTWDGTTFGGGMYDNEFPTIALDRWMHINVNFQSFDGTRYDIRRHTRINTQPPTWPLEMPVYEAWSMMALNDSNDPGNDDLFPNLAHKRVSLYASPDEPIEAGYDEVWTKVQGVGAQAAVDPMQMRRIWQDGNMTWENPELPELELWNEAETLQITNNAPPLVAAGTDYGLVAVGKSAINRFIIKNTGPLTLDITGIGIGGDHPGDFQVLGWPPFLDPEQEGDIYVEFQPTAYTARSAVIDIENNSASDPFIVNVTGIGAFEHVGTAGPGGSIAPEGETPVAAGGAIEYVIQADADYHIYSCTTNGSAILGLPGLVNYTVVWANVTSDGETSVQFTDETATHNTPVTWLRLFYTNEVDWESLVAQADADTDGDGALGWQEYYMDTDPTDSNSVLRLVRDPADPQTIHFDSSSSRTYTLVGRTNLTTDTWSPVSGAGPRAGVDGPDSLTDTNVINGLYYRIQVELP